MVNKFTLEEETAFVTHERVITNLGLCDSEVADYFLESKVEVVPCI